MNALADRLIDDHNKFREYILVFERETNLLASGELSDYGLIEALADYFCSMPDDQHHRIEDIIYLQLTRRLESDLERVHKKWEPVFVKKHAITIN